MTRDVDSGGLARALLEAYRTGVPIAPLSETNPGLGVEEAYAIQAAQVAAWVAEGQSVRGYKVGLTSKAMQAQLGVDQPDFGLLMDPMFYGDGETLEISRFIAPRIEPEIAVILGRDLRGPGVTVADVVDAVESVVGALELIDSRIADWRITLPDTVADNASSAGVVLGTRRLSLAEIDVESAAAVLSMNDHVVGQGTGAAVLGSPLNAVCWLANRLGEFGVTLHANSVVLPGAVCASVAVGHGDRVVADFGPLGTVSIAFGAKEQS